MNSFNSLVRLYADRNHVVSTRYFSRQPVLIAALAYLLTSMLLTWPLVFQLDSVLFGDYADTRGAPWWLWAKTNGFLDGPINHLIAAPFGVPIVNDIKQPVVESLMLVLTRLSNEITAYNLVVFLSFPLTAIATYFFLDRLLHNKLAAFVGGLVFGFAPAAVMQAIGGHSGFSFNVFIPLFLLALFYNRAQRTLFSAFYVGISFALITLTIIYSGYLALYIGLFFLVFDILSCKEENKRAIFRSYLYCGVFAVILILPFEYLVIYKQLTLSDNALVQIGRIRDINALFVYSSRPWEFFIPSIDHPVLGDFIFDFTRGNLHGSNVFEQTLYLGMVPVGLLLVGIILAIRGKFDVDHRTYFLFFVFGALWMYFLSLPPLVSIGSVDVPTVSYFAYYVAPMFRVYARFGILVNLFVACTVAVVLSHLYRRMPRVWHYVMLAVLLPLLVFEYWSIPPNFALSVDQPPKVYQWLAKEPGVFIVAEYPMMGTYDPHFNTYLFWQRIHKKQLANGALPDNTRAWAFSLKVKDLSSPDTPRLLKSIGVKYVIVHREMYQEGHIPEPLKRYFPVSVSSTTYNGGNMPTVPFPLKLIKTFGTDMVFSLDDVQLKVASKEKLTPINGAY